MRGDGVARVTVGRWLGPSTLCNTLEELVNKVQPGGLHVHVVASPGGGVPVLCRPKWVSLRLHINVRHGELWFWLQPCYLPVQNCPVPKKVGAAAS